MVLLADADMTLRLEGMTVNDIGSEYVSAA
jgi:hypothetical protein